MGLVSRCAKEELHYMYILVYIYVDIVEKCPWHMQNWYQTYLAIALGGPYKERD